MIEIHDITNSIFTSKTYILSKEGVDKAWLVDIGDIEPVLSYLYERHLYVEGVFLTHAHFDHIYGLKALIDSFPECKVFVCEYAKQALASEKLNMSRYHCTPINYSRDNVIVVKDGESMTIFEGEPKLEFFETPGHNPGCLTMMIGDYIFTGDSYIPGIGVTCQVPHANKEEAKQSMESILRLAEGKKIFSGHQIDNNRFFYMAKAYVFPGQGAQFVGMGKGLYESNDKAKELFEKANGVLGYNITDIMFFGTDDDLRQTKVTQPAVFLHSVITALCLDDFKPDMVAGHSLGEFSSLVAAGALTFEDGLKLVYARAMAMQKACEAAPSTMAAIIGLPDDVIEKVCAEISKEGNVVVPANYNSPGQVVISGNVEAIKEACSKLKEAGAKRALPLAVGGAFHSPLMEMARVELAKAIEAAPISKPTCLVYQNVDAKPHTDPKEIKENLLKQLTSPVRWTQSVINMINDGMTEFVECGPGQVLTGLIGRIQKSIDN